MSIGIRELLGDRFPGSEREYAQLSDRIRALGNLPQIKARVCPEVFVLHVGINVIGSWKSDGWQGILCDQPELLPHIADAMGALELAPIGAAVRDVLGLFPSYADFDDSALHCDIVNFLTNPRFGVADERLARCSAEERAALSRRYRDCVNRLEDITEPLWGYGAPLCEGWDVILRYLENNLQGDGQNGECGTV